MSGDVFNNLQSTEQNYIDLMNIGDTRFTARNLKFTEDVEITNGNLSNNLCNSFRTKNQNIKIATINFARRYR